MKKFIRVIVVFCLFFACSKEDPTVISITERDVYFEPEASKSTLKINTNASELSLTTDATWLKFSQSPLTNGVKEISLSVEENATGKTRVALVTVSDLSGTSAEFYVNQKSTLFVNFNTNPLPADVTGMASSATDIAKKIRLGWNAGNTLEAIGGETNWGNPKITNDLIQLVKKSGFNAIRLPCAWDQYADASSGKISDVWLNRVKEVVQICVKNDLYVVLNIHWDGGWLENNITVEKQIANNAKQKAFWQQIATHLRDFDEHLLFASANEPNVENATQMAVLSTSHQTFVDAVRSTGGKNAHRVLVVQGPSTDIEKTYKLFTAMPTDKTPNKLMAEIHYYTPWQFCGLTKDESWGKMFYYWGQGNHNHFDLERNATWGQEADVDKYFALMKTQFVDKGIPVILGEFDAVRRPNLTGESLRIHQKSRTDFLKYVTAKGLESGLLPFYWDNGGIADFSSGIFDRRTNTVFDTEALKALVDGAKK